MFGQYFTDSSGARKWGLPPAVFRRSEPMSDAMNAALWNPYYVISSTATWLQSYEIFQKFSEYFRYFQILSEFVRYVHNLFRYVQNCSDIFRIFHMVSECFRMFQNVSEYFRCFQEFSGNVSKLLASAQKPGSGRQACECELVLPGVPHLEPLHRFVHSAWVWVCCVRMPCYHFNSHDVPPCSPYKIKFYQEICPRDP